MELRVQRDPAQGRWDWRGAGTARKHPKCIWGSKMPLVLAPSSLPLSSLELPISPRKPQHSRSRRAQCLWSRTPEPPWTGRSESTSLRIPPRANL